MTGVGRFFLLNYARSEKSTDLFGVDNFTKLTKKKIIIMITITKPLRSKHARRYAYNNHDFIPKSNECRDCRRETARERRRAHSAEDDETIIFVTNCRWTRLFPWIGNAIAMIIWRDSIKWTRLCTGRVVTVDNAHTPTRRCSDGLLGAENRRVPARERDAPLRAACVRVAVASYHTVGDRSSEERWCIFRQFRCCTHTLLTASPTHVSIVI